MEFIKKKVVPSNGQFVASKHGIIYVSPDNSIFINAKKISDNSSGISLANNESTLLFYNRSTQTANYIALDKANEVKSLDNKSPIDCTFTKTDVIVSVMKIIDSNANFSYYLANRFDYSMIKLLPNISNTLRVIDRHENTILLNDYKSKEILGYSIEEETIIWKISNIQGISITDIRLSLNHNGKAYITINKHCLIELDIISGNILRLWNNEHFTNPDFIPSPEERKGIIPYNSSKCFMRSDSMIAGLSLESYWEIDLASGEAKNYYLNEYFREQGQQPFTNGTLYSKGDNLFFSSSFYDAGIFKHSFGAFNINSKTIIARHDFENNEVGRGIHGPVVSGNHLYLADFNHLIHVFEIN